MSIDIKVFQTFSPQSQAAPHPKILAILLQTAERMRGTGPRPTAATNTRLQVREALNVYSTSAQQGEKVH